MNSLMYFLLEFSINGLVRYTSVHTIRC